MVNLKGKAINHPATGTPQSVSLKSREKAFKIKDGKLGDFKVGETLTLSYNYGSLGIVIAGTYQPTDEKEKIYYGYQPGDPEWKRQPPKPAVDLVGQMLNDINGRYKIDCLNAHRTGHLGLKHNCSGGECPGEGALPLLNAYNKRFY